MQPDFTNLNQRKIKETRDRTTGFAFDRVDNASITYLSDDKRKRTGKLDYPQFCQKTGGVAIKSEPAVTGGAKGGLLWIDPDSTASDRSRLIYSYNNSVRLYSIENETDVLLRDIATTDGNTITYLSGEQTFNYALFAIGDSTLNETLFSYSGTTTGVIASVGDNGSGKAEYTDTAHGLQNGNTVTVAGCVDTAYNVTAVVSNVTANTFDIETVTYTATDTGTWSGETLTKATGITGLNAPGLMGKMDNRALVSGVGADRDVAQYSPIETDGNFTSAYTASTDVDGAGRASGLIGDVKAFYYFKGYGYIFEKSRVSPHKVSTYDVYGTGREKDSVTMQNEGVLDGVGVSSPKAVTDFDNRMYFVVPQKGLYEYSVSGGLKELSKKYRPLMQTLNFDEASIQPYKTKNLLVITCASSDAVAEDTMLIYSLDSDTLTFIPNRTLNQVFWDDTNDKMFGLSSIEGKIVEVNGSFYSNEDERIEIGAETRMYDMGDMYSDKKFVSVSQRIAYTQDTQIFNFEIYIDDQDEPIASFSRTIEDLIGTYDSSASGLVWGEGVWGGGSPVIEENIQFATVYWRGFVPHFAKLSVKTKESSPYFSAIHMPVVRWKATNTKVNSFSSEF